jgi:hypothetical protein
LKFSFIIFEETIWDYLMVGSYIIKNSTTELIFVVGIGKTLIERWFSNYFILPKVGKVGTAC